MRIATLIIGINTCLTTLLFAASVDAQAITLDVHNAPLKQVFNVIEKQSAVTFIYNEQSLTDLPAITIKIQNEQLRDVLDKLAAKLPLSFKQSGSVIGVSRISQREGDKINPDKEQSKPPAFITIIGRVIDDEGKPLPGATIKIKNTKFITSSDENGEFRFINAPDSSILIVSFIGYKTKEAKATLKSLLIVIPLETDASVLKEVSVSTGYQTIPLERATGSFSYVDEQSLDRKVAPDIISKLEGITSGVVFNVNPDGSKEIAIRDRSTIFGYSQPLIVVDNFPYDGDINNINPNDVLSVTVLKDAAAASIWGVRAGNGVIVITTKRGKLNEPMHIDVNSNVTVSARPNLDYNPNFLDATDFIGVEKTLFNQGFYNSDLTDPANPPVSPVVALLNEAANGTISQAAANAQISQYENYDVRNDLQKYFYRNAVDQQYSVNINGGTAKTAYAFSAGYDKDLPMQVGSEYDRITINSQNTFNITKNLQFIAGLNYTQERTLTDNTLGEIYTGGPEGKGIYPYAQLADAQGNPLPIVKDYSAAFVATAPSDGLLNWQFLPLQELRDGDNTSTSNNYDVRLNTGVNYKIIKGLSIDIKYQYERALAPAQTLNDENSYYARNLVNEFSQVSGGSVNDMEIPAGGVLQTTESDLASQNLRSQLNYNADWAKNSVNVIAGSEIRQVQVSGNGNVEYGYDKSTGNYQVVDFYDYFPTYPSGNYAAIPGPPNNTGTLNRYRSYFTNGAYTYAQRYTFSASARIDQSNLFGVSTNLKSVPLWSTGFKWDVDKESFYDIGWLPKLKLRATYGYNGNVDNSLAAVTTLQYLQGASFTNANYAIVTNAPNANLQWEKDAIMNLGVDFGLKNNVLSGGIEYYTKRGTDLIGDESLAPSSGYTATGVGSAFFYRGNFSAMTGNGIDVELNSVNTNGAFRWTTHFLFSYATDKVTKYDGSITPAALLDAGGDSGLGSLYPNVGKPLYGIYSYKWGGLDPQNGNPRGYVDGQLSEDYAALTNPTSNSDLVYNGPARPTMFGGMGNTFSYKHFLLTANISYKLGYYFRRSSINYSELFDGWIGNEDFTKRWQQPGDETKTIVPSMPTTVNTERDDFYLGSSALVDNGDHVRLQDVSLSYDFQKNDFKSIPFTHLQVYLYASNLGLIWAANKDHLDPDYPQGGIPAPHSVAIGIKAGF